ncbi:MAG: DUF488 family protein, partial [Desulfovibrio sp.]|nr:DUF488 family protein [Desulfovibrio sp.]
KENKISDIVDVRSVPYSKRFFNYNADVLKPRLRKDGLRYVNFKDEFGARQLNKKYLVKMENI